MNLPLRDSSAVGHKKHKKHKKKHKKKKDLSEDYAVIPEGGAGSGPKIKLKLKIGGQTMGTKNLPSVEKTENSGDDSPIIDVTDDTWGGDEPSFPTKKKGDDTSDEEKEWLDALEKGTLDDSGMLKRSKDPKLMTARQRALIHGQQAELLQLPSGQNINAAIYVCDRNYEGKVVDYYIPYVSDTQWC
ncbi:INO80 complex subunit B-like [Saccostrea echinata]|uniref:INO80 complex subunit B-like n=1 Tax=Saccostrea echinata TaxID=191078 RepID=UPI002A800280|nr:INO80 complex subunit B-like [Saccostrea echinata]